MVQEEPVVIGRGGTHLGVALMLGGAALCLALSWGFGFSVLLVYALGLIGGLAVTLALRYGETVELTHDALIVNSRRRQQRYPWTEILEVSWASSGSVFSYTSGPVLRVRGGHYDEPGPNLPTQVAQLFVFGRTAHRRARRLLREAAERHKVPYSDTMLRDIGMGRRLPRLPGGP